MSINIYINHNYYCSNKIIVSIFENNNFVVNKIKKNGHFDISYTDDINALNIIHELELGKIITIYNKKNNKIKISRTLSEDEIDEYNDRKDKTLENIIKPNEVVAI